MNRVLFCCCVCASVLCVPGALVAQEAGEEGATAATEIDPALVKAAAVKPAAKHFHALVRFVASDGEVKVKLPRTNDFRPAVPGKFYPNGSMFRCSGAATAAAEFEFGKDATLKALGDVEFGTRDADISDQRRTVILSRGTVAASLPRTLPTGLFAIAYPNFTVKDMAGDSRHELTLSGDGNEAVVHVTTGMLSMDGLHYSIGRMSAADRIRIRTTGDALFTSLRGEAGDYKVSLEQGVVSYRDPISGAVSNQTRRLDFSLTPQCAIKIFRKRSQVGGRMAVSVMTFDPSGEMRNRFTFAEGTASVNFGEEVVRIQDISFKTKDGKEGSKDKKPGEAKGEGSGEAGSGESSSSESGSSESGSGESSSSESSESSSTETGGGFGA